MLGNDKLNSKRLLLFEWLNKLPLKRNWRNKLPRKQL